MEARLPDLVDIQQIADQYKLIPEEHRKITWAGIPIGMFDTEELVKIVIIATNRQAGL